MWSQWNEWSKCSVTCGRGHKTSQRTIIQKAMYRGANCEGNETRHEICKLGACPGV